MIVTLKPALTVTDAQAQLIVDRVAPGRRVARIGELQAGEISAVFEIELADDSRSLLDLNLIVMNRFDGRNVNQWEPSLDRDEMHEIYRQIGAALRTVHGVTTESFGDLVTNGVAQPFASNRTYMLSQFERKLSGFAKLGGRPALAERLDAYLQRSTDLLDECRQPVLCHYDYHSGNLLADRRNGKLQLTGIIDLENAIAGDPLMDLAKTIAYSVRDDEC
jgi:aminoglycoside phosphotransferase (APT) family kinase protein